ncbi:ATP-binding cassette domain-containing protein [Phaeovibrio sulfidiphilus]|uniref:ATP-binding cassette domain-containing protein n=1 Tax=Phaeovibrio sulfidiphilus TaxID=1220600 RepID=A0A8J6YMG2_9PROT|nr:ATP-binding cassette domain-containing protein [Phaeovibrio sulfidiphilus]MBE1237300.1 ATP-binding cassette domain-containing protein [Phaeovibrio sulfidiphilus]
MADPRAGSSSSDSDVVVRLRGITNRFGTNTVHQGLDLDVRRGEILGLIGGSGTGKSVLLRTIIGLQRQAEGTVTILGVTMETATPRERAAVRRQWGVLFQDGALFSSLSIGDNIQFPLREFTSLGKGLRADIAHMKLELVGLPQSAWGKFPGEISGGMRKRAGLARALAMDPKILLLDEPTAGLDPIGAGDFDRLIVTLRDAIGLTVILVTHDLDTLYAACDRVAVLSDRKIYAIDTIPNLVKLGHHWIREYFQGPRGRAAEGTYERNQASGAPDARSAAAQTPTQEQEEGV